MIKFLPIVLVLAMVAGVVYLRFMKVEDRPEKATPSLVNQIASTVGTKSDSGSSVDESRIKKLEDAVNGLIKQPSNPNLTNIEARLKTLESAVSTLQSRTGQQAQTAQPTPTQAATKQPPLYVPLSWLGTSTATDWTTISGQSMSLDPADYPGYTSMQFEISLKVLSGNGKAYARLLTSEDGTAILSSEVSTSAYDYTWLTSSGFTLPGKKTYKLQLKSLTGYEAAVQNARLKVNF